MMSSDQQIFNDIGSVLLAVAPEGASKIIMRAQLSAESDHCKCQYDYVDKSSGAIAWFSAGAQANSDLMDLLIELRNYFVDNFKSQEKSLLHGCEITVDVETLKLKIDFEYTE